MKVSDEDSKFLIEAKHILKGTDKKVANAFRNDPKTVKRLAEIADKYGMKELFKHITHLEVKGCL